MAGNGHKRISAFFVLLVVAAMSIVGIASFRMLNVQYKPAKTERSVSVSYSLRDASPEIVESEVTSRIEGVLSGLSGCTGTSSVSKAGSGRVTVKFDKRTDMQSARFEIASAIRNVYPSLPQGVSYPSVSLDSRGTKSTSSLTYLLKSALPAEEIVRFAERNILEPLSLLPEVDNVTVNGGLPYRWVVVFDEEKTSSCGVTAENIRSALSEAFAEEYVGRAEIPDSPGTLAAVRLSAPDRIDFGPIPVCTSDGRIYRLADFATWKYEETPPTSYRRINGLNSVSVDISVASDANLLKSVRTVKEQMDVLQSGFPSEITASIGYDSSQYVSEELGKIYLRTGLCLVILLLLVVAVNRSWRSMLVMAVALAVNILISVAVYALLHIPVHIYTLAGITVSLGIIIDSAVIMTDHYAYYHNRKAIADLVEAVLTTLAALFLILLLPESERANLSDFIYVIAVNLSISLAVAYFFIPALMEYVRVGNHPSGAAVAGLSMPRSRRRRRGKIAAARWNRFYARYINWGLRHRYVYVIVFVLAFGIPLFLIPEPEKKPQGEFYEKYVRPVLSWRPYTDHRATIDKIAGSTFGLFCRSLDKSNFYRDPEKKTLYIRAGMPEGCSVVQLNEVVRSMENYLSSFDEISVFNTVITSAQSALISVEFKPEYEDSSFPSRLKAKVSSMAADFGGANWAVYGIDEHSFNNNIITISKSNRITLTGYNYRELLGYAEILRERMDANRRIIDPQIWSAGWNGKPTAEFVMEYDFERMAAVGISPYGYYTALSQLLCDDVAATVNTNGERTPVVLRSSASDTYDLWHVANVPVAADSVQIALSDVGNIAKKITGLEIRKNSQSYELNVCYDFAGSYELEEKVAKEYVEYMNDNVLPVGFLAKSPRWGWLDQHKDRYAWLILLIIVAIYVMLAISFESLRLPFAVVFMIPQSFIGLFLVFGLSGISFDQGGFAAFVMLCGTTVNAGIYLINEWRSFGNGTVGSYVRAYSRKVKPIMLTIVSTVAGLIPFLTDGPSEVFWFDFAAGAIGGMLISIPALVFVLPVFVLKGGHRSPCRCRGFRRGGRIRVGKSSR